MFPSICSASMHQKLLTLNAICMYSCTDTCIVRVCRSPSFDDVNNSEQNGKYPSIVLSKLKRSDCPSQTEKVGPLPKRSPKGPLLGRLPSKWIHSPSSEIYKFLAPGCTNPSHSAVIAKRRLFEMMPWARAFSCSLRLIQASSQSSHSLWMSLMCPSTSSLQKPGGLLLPPHPWPVMVIPKASPSSFSAHFFPVVTSTSRCPAGFVIVSR